MSRYVGEEHVHHLIGVLTDKQQYEITTDWKGNKYIGITLDWDYEQRQVHLSMPGYVRKALQQFRFFWRAGKLNLADYWTKHHPAMHHKNMRNEFLTQKKILDELRQRLERSGLA